MWGSGQFGREIINSLAFVCKLLLEIYLENKSYL